jgi:hypothetical protein
LRIFFDTNVVVEVEKNKIGFISILSQAWFGRKKFNPTN